MSSRPAPELDLTEGLVTSLLRQQHPDLASLSVSVLDRGWDNTNFRLGDDLMVRMPHRAAAAELIANEQRWLPELAPVLPIAVPTPDRFGQPALGYPWKWSISRWFPGETAALSSIADESETAEALGCFLAALHKPAPNEAPANQFRGVTIRARQQSFNENLALLDAAHDSLAWDVAAITSIFDHATRVVESTERVWLHGDLHAKNVIVDEGAVAAIIDWGDICCGDRATDLAIAWMLVPSAIDMITEVAKVDEPTWARAKGWAVHFAVLYLLHSDDDPVMSSVGTKLINALTEQHT